jgi:hypothetical protein
VRQVLEGSFDKRRRPEDLRIDIHIGQRWPELLHRLFDTVSHVQRVGPRQLFDDQQDAGHVVDNCVTDRRRRSNLHLGHVAQQQRCSVAVCDDCVHEVFGAVHSRRVPDGQSLVRRVDETAGNRFDRISDGGHDSVKSNAVSPQTVRINEHLKLLVVVAPDGDVGDAGNRHQPRPYRPF